MFELSVALKYLVPRRRQLSVSIIALLSIVVIALVVWLVCVFMSVTRGIERRWIETLTALNAPITLTPTDAYYNSYFYQVNGYSEASDYSLLTIGEKAGLGLADPYDPMVDPELPWDFPQPDLTADGSIKDPVGSAFAAVEAIPGATAHEFSTAMGSLRLRMVREESSDPLRAPALTQSFLNQVSFLGSFAEANPNLAKTLVKPNMEDLSHYLRVVGFSADDREGGGQPQVVSKEERGDRLADFFAHIEVTELQTSPSGWVIPPQIYPEKGSLRAFATADGDQVRLYEGRHEAGADEVAGTLSFQSGTPLFTAIGGDSVPLCPLCNLLFKDEVRMKATLAGSSLEGARDAGDLLFEVKLPLKGATFAGQVPYRHLAIAAANVATEFAQLPSITPPWLYGVGKERHVLPVDADGSQGILLAQGYRDHGVRLGDRGYVGYYSSSPSSVQEQRLPVYVAGFYDPGLMPTGNKLILVNPDVTADVRAALTDMDNTSANGIHVWFDDVHQADAIKGQIVAKLDAAGVSDYWQVESYSEYEFARPLLEQFQSDRLLFSTIALIIILVACSNIISMLILLVNDKRREIGILRAMGATGRSIVLIFATCGTAMGLLGSVVGIVASIATLRYLDSIIGLLSALQGHEAFHQAFYGGALPNELSWTVLSFVVGATILLSVIAGIVPAVKAARVRPATILRSQ